MRNRGLIIAGAALIALGLLSILSSLLNINIWAVCWPAVLILIGVGILLGPRLGFSSEGVMIRPLGDVRRRGEWQVADMEVWSFVGDIHLDMREAEIPPGETLIRAMGFVGDVRLRLPQDVGYALSSNAFLTDSKVLGEKSQVFVSTFQRQSENYQAAERRVRLEGLYFVLDLKVDQA